MSPQFLLSVSNTYGREKKGHDPPSVVSKFTYLKFGGELTYRVSSCALGILPTRRFFSTFITSPICLLATNTDPEIYRIHSRKETPVKQWWENDHGIPHKDHAIFITPDHDRSDRTIRCSRTNRGQSTCRWSPSPHILPHPYPSLSLALSRDPYRVHLVSAIPKRKTTQKASKRNEYLTIGQPMIITGKMPEPINSKTMSSNSPPSFHQSKNEKTPQKVRWSSRINDNPINPGRINQATRKSIKNHKIW